MTEKLSQHVHTRRDNPSKKSPKSIRRELLLLLSDGKMHSWRELFEIAGIRYNARITEMRDEGYQIATHMELDASGGGVSIPRTRHAQK